jgi:hypothetical protein
MPAVRLCFLFIPEHGKHIEKVKQWSQCRIHQTKDGRQTSAGSFNNSQALDAELFARLHYGHYLDRDLERHGVFSMFLLSS